MYMNNSIADSNSIRIDSILVPHANAISLITYMLNGNQTSNLKWLDLACGKGQLLNQLGDNLNNKARSRIELHLVDLNNESLRCACEIANRLNLASLHQHVNDLKEFCQTKIRTHEYDFITFVNTLHEIKPIDLADIIVNALTSLSERGVLYIFDQEELQEKELGAITWSSIEFEQLLNKYFEVCHVTSKVIVNRWNHKEINSWSTQILGSSLTKEIRTDIDANVSVLRELVLEHVKTKMRIIKGALKTTTDHGASTAEEAENVHSNLYDFWSLTIALEDFH